jgi:hypothetical protein
VTDRQIERQTEDLTDRWRTDTESDPADRQTDKRQTEQDTQDRQVRQAQDRQTDAISADRQ